MIRNLLATTAIATLLVGGAAAQTPAPTGDATTGAPAATDQSTPMVVHADGHLASNLIGENVYNSTSEDADNIGEVVDLVIGDDGNVEAIVVGVGGFLGIGQKEVALEYDLIEWSEQADGERWLVVPTTKEALEAQQEFDRSAFEPMPADADVGQTQPATRDDLSAAPASDANGTTPVGDNAADTGDMATDTDDTAATGGATTTAPAVGGATTAPADNNASDTDTAVNNTTAPASSNATGAVGNDTAQTGGADDATVAVDRNSLNEVPVDQISADNLIGTTVYGANEENVGEINDVVLSEDGQIDAIIIDVGGFLGIGEKSVAVGMDNLTFMSDEDGDRYLYTEFTEEQLEAQPEYDEATYADQRDEMRLNVQ